MQLAFDHAAFTEFFQANKQFWIPMVFLLSIGESLAFISLVLPATVILLAMSGLLASSGADVRAGWIAAGLGASIGYSASYGIGAYYKDKIDGHRPFRDYPHVMMSSRRFIERHGVLAVFLGHFFGPGRAFVPIVAGMLSMP
jgi:membrane protein DedA with SNARE-associated domain